MRSPLALDGGDRGVGEKTVPRSSSDWQIQPPVAMIESPPE
jgi:hypothetical protein